MSATNTNRDIVYVEIEDEITSLIEKIRKTDAREVALVLPKRSAVLQSIVNIKLLKKSSDKLSKNLVLITNDSTILPLAGLAKIATAANLNAKPVIPVSPTKQAVNIADSINEDLSVADMSDQGNLKRKNDLQKLTEKTSEGAALAYEEGTHVDFSQDPLDGTKNIETVDLKSVDDSSIAGEEILPIAAKKDQLSKKNSKEKVKVPNFKKFVKILVIIIILLIIAAAVYIYSFNVFASANIMIKTNATTVSAATTLTLDTQSQSVDTATGDIPAKQETIQKSYSQTVNTTGQKNEGALATGTVNMSVDDCQPYTYANNPSTFPSFVVPAGTGISYNNQTYITQNDTTLTASKFSNNCVDYTSGSTPTPITAQNPGSSYNVGPGTTFSVNGFTNVQAVGSASGGTDNIVSYVTQADVQSAQTKIVINDIPAEKQNLASQLQSQGYYPIDVTFSSTQPVVSNSPNVGDNSNTVTVTEEVTYSMYGAYTKDIQQIISAQINQQAGKKQNVINYGIYESSFKQLSGNSGEQVSLSTVAVIGPNLSQSAIRSEVRNKSAQAIISLLKDNPNITSVSVNLSPFWVKKAPNNINKITVNISKPATN